MSKDNSAFFGQPNRHPWSKTKDAILGSYLYPYFTKVLGASRYGIVYVDAFAGEGRYSDGSDGSPLLAIKQYRAASANKNIGYRRPIQFVFSEADEDRLEHLKRCVQTAAGTSRYIKEPLYASSYEDAIALAQNVRICSSAVPSTFFYYVDPFGVKDLDLALICKTPNKKHSEVLLNFNSVGFVRAACDALRLNVSIPTEADDGGLSKEAASSKSYGWLETAIGSDNWKDIAEGFYRHNYDFWEAERLMTQLLCENIRKHYRYVTQMPVKDMRHGAKTRGLLKYRLIHMTNNRDGCVIMNDNMCSIHKRLQDRQESIFLLDIDGSNVDTERVRDSAIRSLRRRVPGSFFSIWDIAAEVITECGVFTTSAKLLRACLAPLIESGDLEREVQYNKNGRKANSFSKSSVRIRIVPGSSTL